jgi:hypothetical protein
LRRCGGADLETSSPPALPPSSAPTHPGQFFISGLTLRTDEVKTALTRRNAAGTAFGFLSILGVTPLLAFAARELPFAPPEYATGLALFCIMPTTVGVWAHADARRWALGLGVVGPLRLGAARGEAAGLETDGGAGPRARHCPRAASRRFSLVACTSTPRTRPQLGVGISLIQSAKGNVALAILMTVASNVLGVVIIPGWLKATLSAGRVRAAGPVLALGARAACRVC